MHKLSAVLMVLFLYGAITTGCNKSRLTKAADLYAPYSKGVSFKIDSLTFKTDSAVIMYDSISPTFSVYELTAYSHSADFPKVSIWLRHLTPGTYRFNFTDALITYGSYKYFNDDRDNNNPGTLVISDSGAYIKGTFSYNCSDSSHMITQGSFRALYRP